MNGARSKSMLRDPKFMPHMFSLVIAAALLVIAVIVVMSEAGPLLASRKT